ncbi:hypothetical protein [Phreatobacter sp. AB_2022a]|uniref:hypothetical protein n=1 Tax=Phreatobacter sp. AB_2022a TaxID=3003134 RepID=UPI0022872273|nr:hypothetical protein [Phreatobacter sp. AB_2022a]MCZ0734194.1 hypothetical protein [Phreatobacter sp. AB_2022a]
MDELIPTAVNIDGALLIVLATLLCLGALGLAGLRQTQAEMAVLKRLDRQAARLGMPRLPKKPR